MTIDHRDGWKPIIDAIAKLEATHAGLHEKLLGLNRLLDERDKGYKEQFQASKDAATTVSLAAEKAVAAALAAAEKAVAAALTAAKELTSAAFVASEKAISKAEEAQTRTNQQQNEFRGQLKDQANSLMPRIEAERWLRSLDDAVNQVRENVSQFHGRDTGLTEEKRGTQLRTQWIVMAALGAAGVVITLIALLWAKP